MAKSAWQIFREADQKASNQGALANLERVEAGDEPIGGAHLFDYQSKVLARLSENATVRELRAQGANAVMTGDGLKVDGEIFEERLHPSLYYDPPSRPTTKGTAEVFRSMFESPGRQDTGNGDAQLSITPILLGVAALAGLAAIVGGGG